jgi:hypothetical protein
MDIANIIGLKVVAIKSRRIDMRKKKNFRPQYIVFDDGKTFIELEDQDYYTYHDADSSAKTISINQDAKFWKFLMSDEKRFPDSDEDIMF